jgi:uncharacterized phiE125 gp8 family phage protein
MATVQLTEPAEEPVTDAEVTGHLRISGGGDPLIAALIITARQRAELYTELAFISRSFGVYLDKFPSGALRIPCAPLVSVESVKYFDGNNVEQTLDPSSYYVDSKSKPGRIAPVSSWPATYARPNAVSIEVTAGFGTIVNVPQVIKQAMLLMIGDMYENREETSTGSNMAGSMMPITAEMLLRPFRLLG